MRRGETLSTIAAKYDVSVSALRRANGNIDPRRLSVGRSLRVPSASQQVGSASADKYHRVNRGENLTAIAERYGVSVRQIRSWNSLSSTRIQPGQRLRVS